MSKRSVLSQVIAHGHIEEYKGAETENLVPENKLTPERQAELTAHFHQCEVPFLTCPQCYELYSNIGFQEYKKLCEMYREDLDAI